MLSIKDMCAVIVYFNGGMQIVERVEKLSEFVEKILIVDNNSNLRNLNYLQCVEKINNVEVLYNKENAGIAYALNQGLEFAKKNKYKLLLTLDQDSDISKECITTLIEAIDVKRKIVSVGPVYGEIDKKYNKKEDVSFLITSGNLIYVNVISAIGGYTSELFIDCVDIDFSFNLLVHGYRIQKIGNAYMKHKIGEYERSTFLRIPHLAHNPERYYFKYRNNLIIYKKYYKKRFFLCLKLFLSLCIEFQKIIFIEKRKIKKIKFALNGIKDGLKYKI